MPPNTSLAFRQSLAPTSAHTRHLLHSSAQNALYQNPPPPVPEQRTDRDVLFQHHRFLPSSSSASPPPPPEYVRYESKLYKQFCLVELSRYREGLVAMRWRTEDEVRLGKGEKICGALRCEETEGLDEREVEFKYHEDGEQKKALVKCWLCAGCTGKLQKVKRKKEEKRRTKSKEQRRQMGGSKEWKERGGDKEQRRHRARHEEKRREEAGQPRQRKKNRSRSRSRSPNREGSQSRHRSRSGLQELL